MEEQLFYTKIQQGDVAAFEQLYKKYHPKAFAFCKSILRDSDKAKDVVQESFAAFWEHRTDIVATEAISAYLFRILRNGCLRQLRRDALLNNFLNIDSVTLSELELRYHTEEQNILNDIYFRDLSERYQEALDRLPKQCRTIFRFDLHSDIDTFFYDGFFRKRNMIFRFQYNFFYVWLPALPFTGSDFYDCQSAVILSLLEFESGTALPGHPTRENECFDKRLFNKITRSRFLTPATALGSRRLACCALA